MAITITEEYGGGLARIKAVIVSDSDGGATNTTTYPYNAFPVRLVVDPDAGGTQPTDLFDLVINDSDGYDILNGTGANLSNAANTYKGQNDNLLPFMSKLTITASNMGEAKGATVYLYLVPINGRK